MAPYNEPSFDKQAAIASDYAEDRNISNRWKRRLEGIGEAIRDTTAAVANSNTVNLTESTITSLVDGIVNGITSAFLNTTVISTTPAVPGVTAVHKAVCVGTIASSYYIFDVFDASNTQLGTNQIIWANADGHSGIGNNYLTVNNSSFAVNDQIPVIDENYPFSPGSDYKYKPSITTFPVAAVAATPATFTTERTLTFTPDVNVLTMPKVNVKTDTNDTVVVSGNVTASGTVAVSTDSNGNAVGVDSSGNTTTPSVPVSHSGLPTVTVNTSGASVPVSATATGFGKSAAGTVVNVPVVNSSNVTVDLSTGQTCTLAANQQCTLAPNSVVTATGTVQLASNQQCTLAPGQVCGVDPNATVDVAPTSITVPVVNSNNVTVPVANTSSVSVPVAATSITIPVAPTSITVPVATVTGTTNAADGTGAAVVVPVTASGSVLDVKIVEISSTAPFGGVAPTEAFEAAMEDALRDDDGPFVYGYIDDVTSGGSNPVVKIRTDDDVVVVANTISLTGHPIVTGQNPFYWTSLSNNTANNIILFNYAQKILGLRVKTRDPNWNVYATGVNWQTVDIIPPGFMDGERDVNVGNTVTVAQAEEGNVFGGLAQGATNTWSIQKSDGTLTGNNQTIRVDGTYIACTTAIKNAYIGRKVVFNGYHWVPLEIDTY